MLEKFAHRVQNWYPQSVPAGFGHILGSVLFWHHYHPRQYTFQLLMTGSDGNGPETVHPAKQVVLYTAEILAAWQSPALHPSVVPTSG